MKKKIAFILPNLLAGGTQRVIINIANEINHNKYEIFLVVINKLNAVYNNKDFNEKNFIDLVNKEKVNYINLNKQGVKWSAFKLRKTLRQIKPDIVFSSLSYLNLYIAFIKPLLPSSIFYIARESNTLSIKNHYLNAPKYLNRLYRIFYPKFDKIICQSNDMYLDLADNFFIPKKNLLTINNPIDVNKIESKANNPVNFDSNYKHIVCVGHMSYQKGHDLLLQALAKIEFENWNCHFIGRDAGMKETIHLFLRKNPNISGKIFLHGFQSNPFSYMAKANLFVLASRFEGFPNVLLEAGVLGIPLVAFDNPGGMAEIIKNDKIGLLAKSNNSSDLAKKIDLALKTKYNRNVIKESIISRYNTEVIISKYEAEFDSMMEKANF